MARLRTWFQRPHFASSRLVAIAVAVVLAPIALLGAAILIVESDWAEARIESFASERLGRQVEISNIDIRFSWPPGIYLETLRIANPDWAQTDHLLDVEELLAAIRVWPLFTGKVVIERLELARGRAGLERENDRASWRFDAVDRDRSQDGERAWQLREAVIGDARIFYRDAAEDTALHVHAAGQLDRSDGTLEVQADGRFRGAASRGSATFASLSLVADRPIRGTVNATVGGTSGSVDGTLALGENGVERFEGDVELKGPTLARLHEVLGVSLPNTPPYTVAGHVTHTRGIWRFDPFRGEVGDSTLQGTWSYDTRGKVPLLRADLTAPLLDFDDLAPATGAPPAVGEGETASPRQKRQARAAARSPDVLPEHEFSTERWSQMNADVRLQAKRVEARTLPIGGLDMHLVLEDAVLRLQPLRFEVAGGAIDSRIVLDARNAPLHGELHADVKQVDFARMVPKLQSVKGGVGHLYGQIELAGRGNSVSALLSSADGGVTLAVTGGQISALLIELIGLDLAESLAVLATRNPKTRLRCAVADLDVKSGIARANRFVIDTQDTVIRVDGKINLAREELDLVVRPHPKDPSLLSLSAPVLITGPLQDPDVSLKASAVAGEIAAGVLLGLVNPLLAIAPFIETGDGKDSECHALLARAKAAQN